MAYLTLSRKWLWAGGAVVSAVFACLLYYAMTRIAPEKRESGPGVAATHEVSVNRLPPANPAEALLGTDSSISQRELQLVLVATSPGKTPREGTATLGTDPRNPQTYAAGARLVNGAVIEEVYADHIVLELNAKRTNLPLGRRSIIQRLTSSVPETDATTVGGAAAHQPLDTVATSREDLSEIIRPEPVFDEQGYVGLKILPGRYRNKLEALGLQSGDIVRTIDGKTPKTADAAWQLLDDTLSTGSSIVVTVEREGTLSSMILDGSKITESAVQVNPFETTAPAPPQS